MTDSRILSGSTISSNNIVSNVSGGNFNSSGSKRLQQLDSIRGIAAMIVVLNHYVQVVPESIRQAVSFAEIADLAAWSSIWTWLRFSPLRLFVSGQCAVMVFFVLSGFVLFASLQGRSSISWGKFLFKRCCRIWLPFAAVTLLSAAAYQQLGMNRSPVSSDWLNELRALTGSFSLLAHLLMTGAPEGMTLNVVTWTLIHEMRIAFLLPAIYALYQAKGALRCAALCLVISVMASFGMTDSINGSWQTTAHFLWMFAAGGAIAVKRTMIAQAVSRLPGYRRISLWGVVLVLLLSSFDRVWSSFLLGAGACLLIALCLGSGPVAQALTKPVPLWLGRVSYSLYLIHLPVLMLAMGHGAPLIGLPLVLGLTLLGAELTYRMIEAPSQKLAAKKDLTWRSLRPGRPGVAS